MDIDMYKSTTDDNKYVSVPEGIDTAQLDFPDDLDRQDIHNQITEKGYAIQGATFEASISLTGSSFT